MPHFSQCHCAYTLASSALQHQYGHSKHSQNKVTQEILTPLVIKSVPPSVFDILYNNTYSFPVIYDFPKNIKSNHTH